MVPLNDDPLALDRETMRRLGYQAVDMLVERLDSPGPPLRRATPEEMRMRLPSTDPEERRDFGEILAQLDRDVLPFASRGDHPGFLAFVPFAGTWPGALGDLVASACNIYAGSWMESAGPSRLELEVLDWFKSWVAYPQEAAGVLVSGGSAANMTALACAREALVGPMSDTLVAYVSDQAHSSLARSGRVLGFRPDQVRVIPSDAGYRLRPETLDAAIRADLEAGRKPLFLCATAGATNTGAVDPLPELAALCADRGVWLHVDAAYGGFSTLTERGRRQLGGIEQADSITLDPHKWLYQSYECGCLLVRDGRKLEAAFSITPDYLRDAAVRDGEVNFADLGTQLTRGTRAFKLWISIRYFGLGAFRAAIDRALDLAEAATRRIETSDELELLAPPSLSVVCFRRRFGGLQDEEELARRNAALVAALEESGIGLVSSTRLRGRYAIRICVLSHTTDQGTIDRVLDFLEQADVEPGADPDRSYERDPGIADTWAEQPAIDPAELRRMPLFESLEPPEAERIAHAARIRDAAAGETILTQWETSRDFYVILSGGVDFFVDGAHVARRGGGEFFGELAAIEWGSGFAYSRLATVVAREPTRLAVFTGESTNAFVREFPAVGRIINDVAREQLDRVPRSV